MKRIIGIDPGPRESALCVLNNLDIIASAYGENHEIRSVLFSEIIRGHGVYLAVEKPVCRKWAGVEVSDTAIVSGIFIGIAISSGLRSENAFLITRSKIRWHICNSKKANDSMIRKKLIEQFNPEYNLHHNAGVLKGVTGDIWQALAVAVTCRDLMDRGEINGYQGT